MMKLRFQGQHFLKPKAMALSVVIYSWSLLGSPSVAAAAETDLKVGETIGPQNWQKIQGMVGENLLNRVKAGYTMQIKARRFTGPSKNTSKLPRNIPAKSASAPMANCSITSPDNRFQSSIPTTRRSARNWPGIFSIAGWETTTKPVER